MDVDWLSADSHVLLNPRMPVPEQRRLRSYVIDLPSHIWLATSGTTGALKLTALSKNAVLTSAAAVNQRLEASAHDVWCCVLPTFHVGGLGIHARAFLSRSRVVTVPWDARSFAERNDISLASLVPAQVSDLVGKHLPAPRSLRAIIVGGGALSEDLYRQALALRWPVLPSYGLTECSSQVATARHGSPDLVLLDHLDARTESGRLAFRGGSLLTGYGTDEGFIDPKKDGWLVTEDLGGVEGRTLRIEGRSGDFVKIGGESVDLARLDSIVASIAGVHAVVVAVPDARLGHVIHLVTDGSVDGASVASAYDAQVHPFERVRETHQVAEIPRSSLGKLMRGRLLELLPKSVE